MSFATTTLQRFFRSSPLLIPCWVMPLWLEGANLVAPNQFSNLEAAGFSGALSLNVRLQEVYSATHFPSEPIVITELRFRRDTAQTPFATTIPSIQFSLSTTTKSPDALSSVFAENLGTNTTVVFSGALSLSSSSTSSPPSGAALHNRAPANQFCLQPHTGKSPAGDKEFKFVQRGVGRCIKCLGRWCVSSHFVLRVGCCG